MAKPKTDNSRCKKHPKHQQSPGVCSVCLSEKLSHLTNMRSRFRISPITVSSASSTSSLSSLSSSYSSSMSSSFPSPSHRLRYRHEKTRGSISSLFKGKSMLSKSRSLAFVSRFRGKEEKGGGFWSKLIGTRRKEMDHDQALKHSKTMRERIPTNIIAN